MYEVFIEAFGTFVDALKKGKSWVTKLTKERQKVGYKMIKIGEQIGSAFIHNERKEMAWAFQQFAANLAVCSIYVPSPVGEVIEKIVKTWPIVMQN
jgi:hypothetical protein